MTRVVVLFINFYLPFRYFNRLNHIKSATEWLNINNHGLMDMRVLPMD